jgi:TetR/AcrR family transcriptional repressor of nem operon
MALDATRDTRSQILDVAERLAQTRGFNGFSYADISTELSLRKASIHHHFPTKANLGSELLARYERSFRAALRDIDEAPGDATRKLARYAAIYAGVLREGRLCLCGVLAADLETLPVGLRDGVQAFFVANEVWLAGVLAAGRREGVLRFAGTPRDQARMLVASLEGAMLVARAFGDVKRFETAARQHLAALRRADR